MNNNKKFNQSVYAREYNKIHYTTCKLQLKPDISQKIEDFCKREGISKNKFFTFAALYVIDENVDISAYIRKK